MRDGLLKDFTPLDPGRVDTVDPHELHYWYDTLHCTVDELEDAVMRVGTHVSAVRDQLGPRTGTPPAAQRRRE